jgi:hypothetical protein
MDTHDPRAIAALQQAFLEGRADSALLTSLSREQNTAAGRGPAGPRADNRATAVRDVDGERDSGLVLKRAAAHRVVRRERHIRLR